MSAAWEASEPAKAGPTRDCRCSKRNDCWTGCAPSTCTDKCPAESLVGSPDVSVDSAIGNATELVSVLSRTALAGRNCKRSAPKLERIYRCCRTLRDLHCPFPKALNASAPGADCRIPAAVGQHD